jgi:hypothetical protein
VLSKEDDRILERTRFHQEPNRKRPYRPGMDSNHLKRVVFTYEKQFTSDLTEFVWV